MKILQSPAAASVAVCTLSTIGTIFICRYMWTKVTKKPTNSNSQVVKEVHVVEKGPKTVPEWDKMTHA